VIALSLITVLSGIVASAGVSSPVLQVTVFTGRGWIVDFYPDGRVHAQFGSLPGDGASVPAGTVRFDALLAAIRRLRAETRVDHGTQVAVREAGETSATAFYISDDTLFRYLVASFSDRWVQDAGGTRFHELVTRHPIY
jgi:hypothetical protein